MKTLNLPLALNHLKDLEKSGLSYATIKEASINSVRLSDINKKLGFHAKNVNSAYEIPYGNGYSIYKIFYKEGYEGHKYLAPKGYSNQLYIPPKVKGVLQDPSIPLYITEGEKKALKACQEGLNCIAISGLWNWSNGNKGLIEDFDKIALKGRIICLVPDNDYLVPNRKGEEKNLQQAVCMLGELLIERGSKVSILELPSGNGKIGLDDYLISNTVEEFKQLPTKKIRKVTLKEEIANLNHNSTGYEVKKVVNKIAGVNNEVEKAIYVDSLAKKLNIGKRDILSAIKTPEEPRNLKPILSANLPNLVDIAISDNEVVYVFNIQDKLRIEKVYEYDNKLHIPPSKDKLPFELPRANEVLKWYESNDNLLYDLIAYFRRFSFLPDNIWLIVALKVFLTYIQDHPDIHYLPMLLFYAVPERGKSKTGKAFIYVSYRGIHLVELREANLLRHAKDIQATLFFDIKDLWKKAERNNAEDILLLRFEKGAKASRVIYPEKGAFEDTVYYDIYGATLIATNEAVHKILDTRCLPIIMPNKPNEYETPSTEKAQELKERLTAWRAKVMHKSLPKVETVKGLNGRLWDISKPLLQVCKLICPEKLQNLKEALLEIAEQRIADRRTSIEWQIIVALRTFIPKEEAEWQVALSMVLSELNNNRPNEKQLTPQYLGRKIRSMGIKTRHIHGYSEILLNRIDFDILLTQYGEKNIFSEHPVETLPNSTTLKSPVIPEEKTGRELVESYRNSTLTLPTETVDMTEDLSLVESGRELEGVPEEKKDDLLEVTI